MKKIKCLLGLFLVVVLSVSVVSCSKSDDDELGNPNNGSQNTADVAVTGTVLVKTFNAALLTGYVNLNQIPSGYTKYEMGVQVSKDKTFNEKVTYSSEVLVGNKFEVVASLLNPSATYYYRTYVYANGIYHFGEICSFVTDELRNVASILEVKPSVIDASVKGKIDFSFLGDYAQLFKDNHNIYFGIYASKDKSLLNLADIKAREDDKYTIKSCELTFSHSGRESVQRMPYLEEGTTYYYCTYTKVDEGYDKYGKRVQEIILGEEINSFETLDSKGCLITDIVDVSSSRKDICVSFTCNFYEMGMESYYDAGVQYREKGMEEWKEVYVERYDSYYSKYDTRAPKQLYVLISNEDTKANTTYECRAFISGYNYHHNSIYGNIITFTTK